MSTSGKPAPKRVADSSATEAASVKSGRATRPEQEVSLEALQTRYRKGISLVGTEERLELLPMGRAAQLSALLHVVGPVSLAALTLLFLLVLSWLMHFNFWDLFKSHQKPDLEFSLVKDTQATRPDNAKFKGNFNQRAGGKQDKRQPLKAVEEPPQSSMAQKTEPPKKQTPPEKPEPQQKPEPPKPKAEQPPKPPVKKPEPTKTPDKPAVTPTIPKPAKEKSHKQEAEAAHQAHAAHTKPSTEGRPGTQASTGTSFTGASNSSSTMGNPQEGAAAQSGVDVAEDVDFGPFMADLEKRIKRNWVPPRGAESRKVVLLFYLNRSGKVIKVEVQRSSGDKEADESARQAVFASSPFMSFPPQVKEDVLPVEFTFDYNVLNPKNPKQALKW